MPTTICKDTIILYIFQIFILRLLYIYDYLTKVNAIVAVLKTKPSRAIEVRRAF